MAEIVLTVMLVAAVLYAVLGGADFGAGIIEFFLPSAEREHVDAALLPVWEANHVWLVLVAVLSFVAFPQVFSVVSTYLHIPILLVLLGIVARGSAFTFRHYDPQPGPLVPWYTWAFRGGSVLTPLFLGIIAGAIVQGRITLDPRPDFYAAFVAPWNTPFCWAVGAFTCALFAFQGAALLAAEQGEHGSPLPYVRVARVAHLAAIVAGAFVVLAAYRENLAWLREFPRRPVSIAFLVFATVLIPVVARAFQHGRPWLLRLASAAQVLGVLGGFFGALYPVLLVHDQGVLTVHGAAAPASTLRAMLWALGIGLALILPAFAYLLRVYKGQAARATP